MNHLPNSIFKKLSDREANDALRKLTLPNPSLVDFSSNDYIGFAKNEAIYNSVHQFLSEKELVQNGATGSRLLSGNSTLHEQTENYIAQFHQDEAALLFNSGYDANVGVFSSVLQRDSIILYDELCHASIRDGIRLSNATAYKFQHNDLDDLKRLLIKHSQTSKKELFIATESVFSMDGDTPNLGLLCQMAKDFNAFVIIDEAHALGVFGQKGEGLVQSLGLENEIFARIMTFGKGLGGHGAAVLCSNDLKKYLINFARSLIYTTALSPHAVASILTSYQFLENSENEIQKLKNNIIFFNQLKMQLGLKQLFVYSKSAIQCAIIPGNKNIKHIAKQLQQSGFDVRPILSPTVPEGQERLRFCLHSYNSEVEITAVLVKLAALVF
jgi:8-amino-7-oxononanoate synthase